MNAQSAISRAIAEKRRLMFERHGGIMSSTDVAREVGYCPRASSGDRWAAEHPAGIFAVGNAPTALLRLAEWMEAGKMHPALVIGAPVGFVNVVESKEQIWSVCQDMGVPAIVAMGRKGGSTVAAAVCNALLYQAAGLR